MLARHWLLPTTGADYHNDETSQLQGAEFNDKLLVQRKDYSAPDLEAASVLVFATLLAGSEGALVAASHGYVSIGQRAGGGPSVISNDGRP